MDLQDKLRDLKRQLGKATSAEETRTLSDDIKRVEEAISYERELRSATVPSGTKPCGASALRERQEHRAKAGMTEEEFRADAQRELREAFPEESEDAPHELPQYPADHKVGMVVPKGGSDCAKCEYHSGQSCGQADFVAWNGSRLIPAPVDSYCCDFFSAK